ncbi:P-loop containing nucleoside triphosphate hydrolase protein [Dichomitus squalens LYAD-421 SS1]|uniref:P-loop containing nucleoside triphosphate hydrolase protein n=1 Tax=Dichomitus squalens (strain LYAD-421) TaxID=732165 RepID=R7SUU4_DICSQ|nr:P-loop containing nucleoside triphosphate hydrolase protein [Dichomitus squalens LYAD-421 SS1]EJF59658.1 P-loop containing nucleoside triphosphate hydrolase protein [Dichomitus squalens LYAD-421 SS1]
MDYPMAWLAELSQVPLTASGVTLASVANSPWLDSLLLPVYAAGVSGLLLLAQSASEVIRNNGLPAEDTPQSEPETRSCFRRALENVGGGTIFAFKLAQLLGILGLFGVSLAQLALQNRETASHNLLASSHWQIVQAAQCVLYAYLAALAAVAVFGRPSVNSRAYGHVSFILVFVWSAYMYRDVYPLATLDRTPADTGDGALLYAKFALLTITAVVIPLFVPRKYVPVNPKEVLEPNPEQTASLASLLTFTFMAPIVWTAYKISHYKYEMLPPLADYDHLKSLVGKSFPRLDPTQNKSRRHMGFKVLRVFWLEYVHLASMSVTAVLAAFAAPIAIQGLLGYLESGGTVYSVRPWFWIALLFFGRVFKSISDQWFMFKHTRLSVRIQAVITELVFEHALRIRMKAETSEVTDASKSGEITAVATPDTASQVGVEGEGEGSAEGSDAGASVPAHSATSSSSTAVAPASIKGKGKAPSEDTAKKVAEPSKPAEGGKKGKNLVGRINNLVTSDLSNLEPIGMFVTFATIESPFQITLCMVFLYQILGWSALVGLATMLITLPVPGWITKHIQGTQREKMKRTDARVQTVTEMMGVIRMIKLFGWEHRINKQLNQKRDEELVSVKRNRMLGMLNNLCNFAIPTLIMLSTFATYSMIMKQTLTASKVFSAMSVFDMLRMDIQATFFMIPGLIQAKVSLERIHDFLYNTELIDEFAEPNVDTVEIISSNVPEEYRESIGIRHASFTWANDSAKLAITPGGTRKRTFVLHIDDEVFFKRGKINLIVGPTGSGKTSLLMALLGEMHYIPAGPDSFVSLPREGGVAYAAQESWVQNDTIKNNILFGAPFDEVRYKKVLKQCALERDLSLFDAGDQTEVGEKGVTLSGGQKARITLARAVYSSAQILLLDDILAALDVHTSRWIVDKCLSGDLVRGRTVILVTHNIAMVSPIADFVVDVGSDGRILSQGTLSNALAHDDKLLEEVQHEAEELQRAEEEIDGEKPEDVNDKSNAGKLVVAEEIEEGHVGLQAMLLYLGNLSTRPLIFWFIYVSAYSLRHFITNVQSWWLGYWAAQYEAHAPEDVKASYYLAVYCYAVLAIMSCSAFCVWYYVNGSMRASKIVHERLVTSLLGTTLRWLDKTPTARIIARCTEDIQTMDTRFARNVEVLIEVTVFLLMKVFAIVAFTPLFFIPSVLLAIFGGVLGHIYMKAQLSVKREMSVAKAPVVGHFGAAISGITSIRAYGAQESLKREAYVRIDRYSRVAITNFNLNRWMTIRVDLAGTVFLSSLAIWLLYFAPLSASNTGFSLAMAAAFSNNIFAWVRIFNDLELSGNSLERIQQYLVIEHEPQSTPEGVPPAYWPASGALEVNNLSARYSADGPKVLHEISFDVNSGERVGIVGRTGSGKSSLTLALLRCILTEGLVRYDGLPTDKINLDALRSNITIIPQVPEMLSGTLRQNLDPFGEHDDAVLNDALRSAGLFNLQDEHDESRITLDSEIAGGGANLSVGQRQVLALARAIVRRSKLLILDEATSAIDYETDSIIQKSLRTELGKDVTLLTVAHRLQTIMDSDKIMVLDAGHIVEFGRPSELLRNEKGFLRALVDESGDREKLYAMAAAAAGEPSG